MSAVRICCGLLLFIKMSDINFEGSVGLKDKTYHLGLSLVEFTEDNVIIIYSPALDLSGYGYTRDEAKKSFQVALHEFFKYTTDK